MEKADFCLYTAWKCLYDKEKGLFKPKPITDKYVERDFAKGSFETRSQKYYFLKHQDWEAVAKYTYSKGFKRKEFLTNHFAGLLDFMKTDVQGRSLEGILDRLFKGTYINSSPKSPSLFDNFCNRLEGKEYGDPAVTDTAISDYARLFAANEYLLKKMNYDKRRFQEDMGKLVDIALESEFQQIWDIDYEDNHLHQVELGRLVKSCSQAKNPELHHIALMWILMEYLLGPRVNPIFWKYREHPQILPSFEPQTSMSNMDLIKVPSDQVSAIQREDILPDSEVTSQGSRDAMSDSKGTFDEKEVENVDSKPPASRHVQELWQKIQFFYHRNDLALINGVCLALCPFLYISYTGTSMVDFFLIFFNMPMRYFFVLIAMLAVLPRVLSVLEPYLMKALSRYKVISTEDFEDYAIAGKKNMQYGLACNILSAMCTAAFFLFSNTLNGMADFIRIHPINGYLILLVVVSISISMNWNFQLQLRPEPEDTKKIAENPNHYLLYYPHVSAIMIHQVFTMIFDGTIIIYMFWYGIVNRHLNLSLNGTFFPIIVLLSLYFGFASVSDRAKELNVDCVWMIHLIPLMSLVTLTYAIGFFTWSEVTWMCVLANLISLAVWAYYLVDGLRKR